jgi:hypothetical protein
MTEPEISRGTTLEEKVNWLITQMHERIVKESRVSREEVIRNPRLSGGFRSSSIGSGGAGPGMSNLLPDPREELFSSPIPPRHQGRYTLSPQVNVDDSKDPVDPPSPTSVPAAAVHNTLTAAQRRAGEERLLKKVKTPPTFSGNDQEDEITEVRDWVEVVDDFFHCMVGAGYDGEYALTFVMNNLRGPAHDWMKGKVAAFQDAIASGSLPENMRQGLKWGEVKKLLVEAFESPQYTVMKRFELQELRLGQGKHRTLPIFNAAFDKLSRRLWPIGTDFENNIILDRVLADEYSTILERSDLYLWRDVVKTGPRTLSQWKAATAVVWSAREVLRTNEHRHRQGSAGRGGNRRSQFSGRPQGGAAGAAVQEMDAQEDPQEGDSDSDEETAGQRTAAAQQVQAQKRGPRRDGPSRPSAGDRSQAPRLLTDEQMRTVLAKRLCYQCYKAGHRRGDDSCPEKGKPRRKPTQAELNA